jgi:hypothetical protein
VTRIYENTGLWRRSIFSVVVVIAALIWGVFEFWSAITGPPEAASNGYLFGVLFLGGGLYAIYQLLHDWRDLVMRVDLDEATGAMIVNVWRAHSPLKIATTKDGLTNWRPYVELGPRNTRMRFIYADHASYPRRLRFDVRKGIDLTGLRRLAPEAMAEHDEATGGTAQ